MVATRGRLESVLSGREIRKNRVDNLLSFLICAGTTLLERIGLEVRRQVLGWAIKELTGYVGADVEHDYLVVETVKNCLRAIGIATLPEGDDMRELITSLTDMLTKTEEPTGYPCGKDMPSITVSASVSGMIRLSHDPILQDEQVILVHPAQVETLVNWMRSEREDIVAAWADGIFPQETERTSSKAQ